MRRRWIGFGAGAACLVAGGALLALAGEAGTVWGTALGLVGVGMIGWSWLERRGGEDRGDQDGGDVDG